jgi:hypothetical protein
VLQYGGSGRYQHVAAPTVATGEPLAESAIYHVGASQHLAYALDQILHRHHENNTGSNGDLFAPYRYRQDEHESLSELLVA